jgi:RND superfamily putative drug exporter
VTIFDGARTSVEPGGTLVVTGDARATRAFALVVGGRLAPDEGRIRVAGHLLPGRAAWVRGHVGLALLGDADDPVREIRSALDGRPSLIVIDGVDALDAPRRDQAAALLRDASARLAATDDTLTIVATARSEGAALALLAEAHRPRIDALALRVHSASSPAPEVNA